MWISKNNPAWDKHIELYEETKMDDNFDPQWEATIRGDKEGLCLNYNLWPKRLTT